MKLLKSLQKTVKPVTKMVKKGNKLMLLLGVLLLLALVLVVGMYMKKREGFNTNDYTFDGLKNDINTFGNTDTTTIRIPTTVDTTVFGKFTKTTIDNKKKIVFKKTQDAIEKPVSYIVKGQEYGNLRIYYEDNTNDDVTFYYKTGSKLTNTWANIIIEKIKEYLINVQKQEGIESEQMRIKEKLKNDMEISDVDTNTVNNVVNKAKAKYDGLETVLIEQGFIYRPPPPSLMVSA